MNYRPNPLLYAAHEDFLGTFKLVVTLCDNVDHALLKESVAEAMVRYPYFSVTPEREGNSLLLKSNERPVPVFEDGRCVLLGSEESNGHLITFGCEGVTIIFNCSHYIADGMGSVPLVLTVLYLYAAKKYGTEGLRPENIPMPGQPVGEGEYCYPFAEKPVEIETGYLPRKTPEAVYKLDPAAFDDGGLYAYHIRVPQKAMMSKASPSDGSPVSYLSVMMYRALCGMDPEMKLPVVVHVQHQYRAALKAYQSRHSLVSYVPVMLTPKAAGWHVERQNTVIRGQVILGSEKDADLDAVNRLIAAFPAGEDASYDEKQMAMRRFVDDSTLGKSLGISYVGKLDWCGLDKYVDDMHAYIGEKHTRDMMLIEVMTIDDDFSINLMQSGKGRRYVDAFIAEMEKFDIPVRLAGEERFELCGTRIPE